MKKKVHCAHFVKVVQNDFSKLSKLIAWYRISRKKSALCEGLLYLGWLPFWPCLIFFFQVLLTGQSRNQWNCFIDRWFTVEQVTKYRNYCRVWMSNIGIIGLLFQERNKRLDLIRTFHWLEESSEGRHSENEMWNGFFLHSCVDTNGSNNT